MRQRLTRSLGGARNGQREEQREKDERHHCAIRGGGDRVRRKERDKPRGKRLCLSSLRNFVRRFDRAGRELQRAVRRQEPERRQRERDNDGGDSEEKQQKS